MTCGTLEPNCIGIRGFAGAVTPFGMDKVLSTFACDILFFPSTPLSVVKDDPAGICNMKYHTTIFIRDSTFLSLKEAL